MTRVLVVEDEESYSDALSYLLRKEGYDVAVAGNGIDALKEFDRNGADIVLLDLMLPGLPGTEVCREIKDDPANSKLPVVLITTKGHKSGKPQTFPLVYLPDGNRYVIIASKGGAPTNPAWYYNLTNLGTATVEIGTEKFDVDVTEVKGEERDALYARQVAAAPGFADYEAKTKGIRTIPVLALTRKK